MPRDRIGEHRQQSVFPHFSSQDREIQPQEFARTQEQAWDPWPELPQRPEIASRDYREMIRALERIRKLELEQRGDGLWNVWHS
jgi:hypothetical protein